ncbi:MAG: MEDS domain-containing protein [Candidatus Bathyarchaeum sp.]|nr:MAG: MEDS domain-containing protein [Candidatus Bathyarchaeum sp.]
MMFLGDHESYFYDTFKQKQSVLFANMINGINAGCSILYIAGEEDTDTMQTKLGNLGLKKGDQKKLKIVTSYQWYTPDGDFDPRRVIDQYRSLIDEALDNGFAGLYVSADAADTFDYLLKKGIINEWLDYEGSLGTTFKFPMEAICAYKKEQVISSGEILLQLLKGHKHTISDKTEKRILNEQMIRGTVFQEFKKIFGNTIANVIFDNLDDILLAQNFSQPNDEKFYYLLESIQKEGDSRLFSRIEQNILKRLYTEIS